MLASSQRSCMPSPSGVTALAMSTTISVGNTIMLNEHVASRPALSVNVYSTGVVPVAKVLPGACVRFTDTRPQPATPSGSSHVTSASPRSSDFTVIDSGHAVTTGPWPDVTLTLKVQV